MVKVTCDMCGKELDILDRVDLHIDTECPCYLLGDITFHSDKEKHLCRKCATRLVNWINNQLEKGSDN